jgi:hypothetical protein
MRLPRTVALRPVCAPDCWRTGNSVSGHSLPPCARRRIPSFGIVESDILESERCLCHLSTLLHYYPRQQGQLTEWDSKIHTCDVLTSPDARHLQVPVVLGKGQAANSTDPTTDLVFNGVEATVAQRRRSLLTSVVSMPPALVTPTPTSDLCWERWMA